MWEALVPLGCGPANAITDVAGVQVGHHHRIEDGWATGTTVVIARDGAIGGIDVGGGAPGTRETDLLAPGAMVERVHAICLTGGSAYGLAAADGVMRWLAEQGIGLPVGQEPHEIVPIVPTAVLFDLRLGDWGNRPDASFGYAACAAAASGPVAEGCVGAGAGATGGPIKGGLGTASTALEGGFTVGALAVLNARGHAIDPGTGVPYGIGHGLGDEFAGWRAPSADDVRTAAEQQAPRAKMARLNTTLVVVATDAALTKSECKVVASVAQDGVARAVRPAHTLFDGDCIFTLATGALPLEFASTDAYAAGPSRAALVNDIAAVAADTVARAIVRALLTATSVHGSLSYRDLYPSSVVPRKARSRSPSPLPEAPP
jgi:L-aminopeptidase/D-esterase-like protein